MDTCFRWSRLRFGRDEEGAADANRSVDGGCLGGLQRPVLDDCLAYGIAITPDGKTAYGTSDTGTVTPITVSTNAAGTPDPRRQPTERDRDHPAARAQPTIATLSDLDHGRRNGARLGGTEGTCESGRHRHRHVHRFPHQRINDSGVAAGTLTESTAGPKSFLMVANRSLTWSSLVRSACRACAPTR